MHTNNNNYTFIKLYDLILVFFLFIYLTGEIMCRLFPLLRYGLLAVSLFTVLTITINRYIMIGHPRIYPR